MLLWKVMVVWIRCIYYTILKSICKDEKWKFLVKKCDLSGISSQMNIPTPYALKASFQIFRWGMRTHATYVAGFGEPEYFKVELLKTQRCIDRREEYAHRRAKLLLR